jgi:signal transduction histidine kinase
MFSFDYKIEFDVSDDGDTKIIIWRDEFDFKDKFSYVMHNADFSGDDRGYFSGEPLVFYTNFSEVVTKDRHRIENSIGQFSGVFYFLKLSIQSSEKDKYYYKDITGRKDFREVFGGIKIYRDNFRVRPYGDPKSSNYDWLQLAGRKNRSPASVSHKTGAWRVSADQMLGSVYISRTNRTLPDQANREGIVETKEFKQLKEFLLNVIQYMERDRQYVCRKLNALYERDTETEQYLQEIQEKASASNTSDTPQPSAYIPASFVEATKAKLVIDQKDEIIRNLEDESRLLRVLATTGIATNTYIHEFKDLTHRLNMKIVMAKEALELDDDRKAALEQIQEADRIRNSFNSWFLVTIESVRRDKRSLRKVVLNDFITQAINAWEQVISNKGISIITRLPDDPVFFRCFPYEIEIVFSNLITNSVSILGESTHPSKEIHIGLQSTNDSIFIDYSDNGPGLSSQYKNDPLLILEPFETDKANTAGEIIGTGMGMWIIKRTISEYNGSMDLSKNRTASSGFYLKITLPKNC